MIFASSSLVTAMKQIHLIDMFFSQQLLIRSIAIEDDRILQFFRKLSGAADRVRSV
jgi:hypothetical protein